MNNKCFKLPEYGVPQQVEFLLRQGVYDHPMHDFGKVGLAKYWAQVNQCNVATGVYANKN